MNPVISPASADLGLGDMLSQQVRDETDDERKKRIREQQQRSVGGGGAASALGIGMTGGLGGPSVAYGR